MTKGFSDIKPQVRGKKSSFTSLPYLNSQLYEIMHNMSWSIDEKNAMPPVDYGKGLSIELVHVYRIKS